MGNCLAYPPKVEYDRQQKKGSSMTRTNLQGTNHTVLPFNSFNGRGRGTEQSEVNHVPDPVSEESKVPDLTASPDISQIEMETTRLGSNPSSRTSSFKRQNRYIKRYRNEEEKLVDMLQERERLFRSAIKQGQELRAKCNRYKDELDSLKALSDVDMTDVEWKKKYSDLDKRYRDMKEELDIIAARNKNGREYLNQQKDTIQLLSDELHRERIERQRAMSSSFSSLTSAGITDKKGKLMVAQLEAEKSLLGERLTDLSIRNRRGRDYLTKVEGEKREQEALVTKLKTQLLQEQEEREHLLDKVEMMSSSHNLAHSTIDSEESGAVYAKVHKTKAGLHAANPKSETRFMLGSTNSGYSEVTETKSLGFEIDNDHSRQHHRPISNVYEDVTLGDHDYLDGRHTLTGVPFIHTYVLEESEIESPNSETDTKTSTPRFETAEVDDEPVWDEIPGTGLPSVQIESVITKF